MKRGVVFDLDGVLVRSEHLWEEAWQAYAAEHGYAWTLEDTRHCQGLSVPEWSAYLAGKSSGEAEAGCHSRRRPRDRGVRFRAREPVRRGG